MVVAAVVLTTVSGRLSGHGGSSVDGPLQSGHVFALLAQQHWVACRDYLAGDSPSHKCIGASSCQHESEAYDKYQYRDKCSFHGTHWVLNPKGYPQNQDHIGKEKETREPTQRLK
eukprot:scaffold15232_cov114-Skeletonema_marinoi.AAC.3